MPEHIHTAFANTPTPWLPDQTFWQQNAGPIGELQQRITADYPHTAAAMNFDPHSADLPPDEQRRALWAIMMGKQHGGQSSYGDSTEKVLIPHGVQPYQDIVDKVQYGPYHMTKANPIQFENGYHTVWLPAEGSPVGQQSQYDVVRAPGAESPQDVVVLTGQRLRGGMNDASESASPKQVVDMIGAASGTDMDELAKRSPWLRNELARTGEGWGKPFASEHDLVRLTAEAGFADLIDWKRYDGRVETRLLPGLPNEEIVYNHNGKEIIIPMRQHDVATYYLKNGQRLHVTNGPVAKRPNGEWRATAESTARAAVVGGLALHKEGRYVSVATAPHLRTGLDVLIPLLKQVQGGAAPSIERFDLASAGWNPSVTPHLTAALGELMATMKADRRVREAYRGGDPYSPAMEAI